jgi:hypothetical protein
LTKFKLPTIQDAVRDMLIFESMELAPVEVTVE